VPVIFIRIEPTSAVPIYRQIVDQIKYQIATGVLKESQQMPSVRQLAQQLAVNQNTILKVYNQLCQENVLQVERGSGTFVTGNSQTLQRSEMRKIVAQALREAAVQAIHFGMDEKELQKILTRETQAIKQQEQKSGSSKS
jgi:GntR family transcriptional regulator